MSGLDHKWLIILHGQAIKKKQEHNSVLLKEKTNEQCSVMWLDFLFTTTTFHLLNCVNFLFISRFNIKDTLLSLSLSLEITKTKKNKKNTAYHGMEKKKKSEIFLQLIHKAVMSKVLNWQLQKRELLVLFILLRSGLWLEISKNLSMMSFF